MKTILTPSPYMRITTCPECGCLFTFDRRTDTINGGYDWGLIIKKIECPYCKEIFELWKEKDSDR